MTKVEQEPEVALGSSLGACKMERLLLILLPLGVIRLEKV